MVHFRWPGPYSYDYIVLFHITVGNSNSTSSGSSDTGVIAAIVGIIVGVILVIIIVIVVIISCFLVCQKKKGICDFAYIKKTRFTYVRMCRQNLTEIKISIIS